MLVIIVIFGGLIVMSLMGAYKAMQCPECRKKWALKWQDHWQRDKCKYCGYLVHAKDFIPPKTSYLKFLHDYSPITYKYKKGEKIDKEKL